MKLAVDLRRVYVETRDQRDEIGDHEAARELVDDAHRRERAGADAHAVRIFAAVAYDVVAHVAARRLDADIDFARRRFELARHFGDRRPLRHHLQALPQDLARFLQLLDAHPVAVVAVAERALLALADRHI